MFTYKFIIHAFQAGFFTAILCGICGVFLINLQISFLGICVSHAALAGALMGLWIGFNPLIAGSICGITAACIIGPLADKGKFTHDTSAGIIFSFMLALAFLFLGLIPDMRAEAFNYFWGGILTVTKYEILVQAFLATISIVLVILFHKEILAVICHREIAYLAGIPATVILYSIFTWLAVCVAASMRTVGGLLIYSLLINPAAAALQLSYRLKTMYLISCCIGVLSCWVGISCSYFFNLPAGATIALVSTGFFAISYLLSPKRK